MSAPDTSRAPVAPHIPALAVRRTWLTDPAEIDAALSRHAIDARAWSLDTHPDAPVIADPTLGFFPNICLAEGGVDPTLGTGFYYVCTRIPHQTGRHACGSFGRLVAVWGEAS